MKLKFARLAMGAVCSLSAPLGAVAAPSHGVVSTSLRSVTAVPNLGGQNSVRRGDIQVTVTLPLRASDALDTLIRVQGDPTSPFYRHFLTPAQFRAEFGPPANDLAVAAATLRGMGFNARVTSQQIFASAPQSTIEGAFGIRMRAAAMRGMSGVTTDRLPVLPAALARLGAAVHVSHLLRQTHSHRVGRAAVPQNRYGPSGPYWFTDLKQAYGYPSYQKVNGRGRTIAIVISSDVLDSDLKLYFGHEGLTKPVVERRPVNGGPPAFDPNSSASDEASLDVQQSLGSAPGARAILYDTPDISDQNVFAAYQQAVDDNTADVVSSSFGLCELYYRAEYNNGVNFLGLLSAVHDVFRQGNAQGITFVASSGDSGAYECFDPTGTRRIRQGVSSPADDTDVTAVGGSNLVTKVVPNPADPTTNSLDSSYVEENADLDHIDPTLADAPYQIWASGGGISKVFGKPLYQYLVPTGDAHMRTVPDIAMHMGGCPSAAVQPCDPERSSVIAAIGGDLFLLIGTSAAAPEFAGLLAVTEQSLGTRLGNANPYIYELNRTQDRKVYRHFHGLNGYPSNGKYDYVVGNGTPHAAAFAGLPNAPLAGLPLTPSNP